MAAVCPDKQEPSFHGNKEDQESWNEAGLSTAAGVVSLLKTNNNHKLFLL